MSAVDIAVAQQHFGISGDSFVIEHGQDAHSAISASGTKDRVDLIVKEHGVKVICALRVRASQITIAPKRWRPGLAR